MEAKETLNKINDLKEQVEDIDERLSSLEEDVSLIFNTLDALREKLRNKPK